MSNQEIKVPKTIIAPSILAADFTRMEEALHSIKEWGAEWVHCDVMDGMFVPNITFGQKMIEDFRKKSDLFLDVHLMVQAPERYIDEFIANGADMITVHAEATTHLHRTILQVRNQGVKVGVAINPATPINAVEEVLGDIDMVLLMSCDPGFGGQPFIPYALEKSRRLRKMMGENQLDIEVDGGVSEENIDEILDSGINVIVAGSALFKAKDPKKTLEVLRHGTKR